MDLESAPAVATVAQPANALGPDNEKELESKDTESDVGAWLCVFASLLFLTSSYGKHVTYSDVIKHGV